MAITVKKKQGTTLKTKSAVAAEAAAAAAPAAAGASVPANPLTSPLALDKGPSYTAPAIIALFATLMFGALLLLQWMEYDFYHNQPPTAFPLVVKQAAPPGYVPPTVDTEGMSEEEAMQAAEVVAGSAAVGLGALLAGIGLIIVIVAGVVGLLLTISTWVIFSKAGKPGVASIIPIWQGIVFCQVGGKPGWWFLLLPLVIPGILVVFGTAKNFGKGAGFALGMLFLPIIFYPILAFGSAQYATGMQLPPDESE